VSELISSSDILSARNAVVGAVIVTLVTAAGLAGCGRKGGLDPPPAAAVVDERGVPIQPAVAPESAPNGQAVAPAPPPRRETWLDWLIN
jgi:predicted small lipoprotein YifL